MSSSGLACGISMKVKTAGMAYADNMGWTLGVTLEPMDVVHKNSLPALGRALNNRPCTLF